MGLLDEILGAATRSGQTAGQESEQGAAGGLGGLLGGLLHGQPGSASNHGGGFADVLGSLLGNDGRFGGLDGVLSRFEQAGLGNKAGSWVSNGPNDDVSGAQVSEALGHDTMSDVAKRLNIDPGMAGSLLATLLPLLIDRLTPHGQAPQGGLGDRSDILGRLGDMLRNR